jgi:hypothetical protein
MLIDGLFYFKAKHRGWGVVLFFPTAAGEYTISNISISSN